jgi:hypothetical protein
VSGLLPQFDIVTIHHTFSSADSLIIVDADDFDPSDDVTVTSDEVGVIARHGPAHLQHSADHAARFHGKRV